MLLTVTITSRLIHGRNSLANFKCPTCGSDLRPLMMNKAAFENAINYYECTEDTCDYETEVFSSLDKNK